MKELTALLSGLVAVPSVSGNEDGTARLLAEYLSSKPGIHVERIGNNVVAKKATYRTDKPVVMLCSHHDTVAPRCRLYPGSIPAFPGKRPGRLRTPVRIGKQRCRRLGSYHDPDVLLHGRPAV